MRSTSGLFVYPCSLILCWVALACPTLTASAQFSGQHRVSNEVKATGVRSHEFQKYYREQQKRAWCWAACIEMVLDSSGVNVNQPAIVHQVYGSDWSGRQPDAPGTIRQMIALLNQWGIDDHGKRFTVNARGGNGAPSPAWLLGELRSNHPVIILFNPSRGNIGHFVVVTGAYYRDSSSGPQVDRLVIWDPFPYHKVRSNPPSIYVKNVAMTGRYEVPAAAFMRTAAFHCFTRATSSGSFTWPSY